ncbi:MAG TPA: chromosomal replication initiator protein DnaA [Dehalococcoidales bacterium]|nr:chromosomal replication initiator protein DnaA [Dehalococcoidales bacterium]
MDLSRPRTPQEIWETALGELQVQVSKPNFRTWFSKTSGLSYQDNQFLISVPNTFAAEYLEKNQRSLIEKALGSLTAPGVKVVFQVNGKSGTHISTASTELPAAPPVFTRLNPDYTFDSFIEGAANRLARAAALSVAQNPGRSYNPLFIYSGPGLGKTHLMHAIGQEAAAHHINVICTSAEQFTNEFLTALREHSTEEFRNKYRSLGMLLIDDIQFIGGKEQTEESFFHTFNELHNTNRQIVLTCDTPPKNITLMEERLRSRFEWGLIVDIQPPDFDTRFAILQSKAARKGITIAQDVIDLVAREAYPNIRSMEGALNRVIAYARLLRVVPTLEIAAKALEDVANKDLKLSDITPATIVDAVAGSFQLTREALTGPARDKDTALARRLAMYLIRKETNCSLVQIGQELGDRDAAAVTTACKKVAADIENNSFLKRKCQDIAQQLHPAQNGKKAAKAALD